MINLDPEIVRYITKKLRSLPVKSDTDGAPAVTAADLFRCAGHAAYPCAMPRRFFADEAGVPASLQGGWVVGRVPPCCAGRRSTRL